MQQRDNNARAGGAHRVPEGDRAAVDYTPVRNVKKPYGARPGRVIYTEQTTLMAQSDPEEAKRLRIE